MPRRYRAFLSYSRRYAAWVQALHRNLERRLGAGSVFLDQVDIGPGKSWNNVLQEGIAGAEYLVPILTPEAVASPYVEREIDTFFTQPKPQVVPVLLVAAPKLPFLQPLQHVDFTKSDPESYRKSFAQLCAALEGREDLRRLTDLPPNLEIPPPPAEDLPAKLRDNLLGFLLEGIDLNKRRNRTALGTALKLRGDRALEGFPTLELTANAALVLSRGDDTAPAAALRLLEAVVAEFGDDAPELAAQADVLRQKVEPLASAIAPDSLIPRYLQSVEDDHRELVPYFRERRSGSVLEHVYVHLRLSAPRAHGEIAGSAERLFPAPLTLAGLLALDPKDYPWITRRWVVLGDPGAGKTTLLRHYAHQKAKAERVSSATPLIPVFVSLPALVREREPLLERIERLLGAVRSAAGLKAALDQAGKAGRLLLLFDSLDEVPETERAAAALILRSFAREWPDSTMVVTSRPIGFSSPGSEYLEVQVQPLDREQRREFLGRWFGEDSGKLDWVKADASLNVLESDSSLWELSGVPLYLTLMAILFAKGEQPSSKRSALYDQIFDLLLEGDHKDPKRPIPCKQAVSAALRGLAYAMTELERYSLPLSELESLLYQESFDELRQNLERLPDWRPSLRRFLEDVAEYTGILGSHDGADADWRFWHKSFQEALTSEVLALRYGTGQERALEQHARSISGKEGPWAEPYALLAGRVAEPDRLILALTKVNRALGLRALATAQGVREQTLQEILKLSEDWEQRAKVYGEIPGQVGDPERAVLLLDRLRRKTRNGNDLYFLDQALVQLAAAHPDHAAQAQGARGRLFAHLPSPAEIVNDGKRWREIRPGRFRMGDQSQGPEHWVQITRPFRLGTYPVTNGRYALFDPDHKSYGGSDHPVVNVTWYQAQMYCRWLGGDLPSEAQWEYACRAGTTTPWSCPEGKLKDYAWFGEGVKGRPHPVGQKKPNPWGLYDMHGNVWEWCRDWYGPYEAKEQVDPAGPASGADRVMRGGSCWVVPDGLRSACRLWGHPGLRNVLFGFRVVLPLPG